MDDLISRAAAIEEMRRFSEIMHDNRCKPSWYDAVRIVKDMPAVDAAPVVHARWIDYKDDHQCSACKEHTIFDFYAWKAIQFEFCPNCGAKMDDERRDEDGSTD